MFFSATTHCKALPSWVYPKNTKQQLVLAVVVDSESYAAVGQLLFSILRHDNRQTAHVLAIKCVKHTTKQLCQRDAQQGQMGDAICTKADRWDGRPGFLGRTGCASLHRITFSGQGWTLLTVVRNYNKYQLC